MADRGRGLARPTCGAGVYRSFSVERSHRAPAARLPALCSGPPPFRCGEVIFPSLLTKTFLHQFQVGKQQKLKSFFHAFQAPLDRLADGLLMYPIGLGNLFDAYAKNDMSVDPAALDLRQGVEGVPEPDKQRLSFPIWCGYCEAPVPGSTMWGRGFFLPPAVCGYSSDHDRLGHIRKSAAQSGRFPRQ